jgi:catechol 2,3-dioxygenase-like lactoylglutathione lyase family enzyme
VLRADAYADRMINGSHVILFSSDPEADRAFFADVLKQPHVDAGAGWLIFKLPPAELAMHPADGASHELYFMCDELDGTIRDLQAGGVEFTQEVAEERWGRVTRFRLPSGSEIGLYEPRHPRATEL